MKYAFEILVNVNFYHTYFSNELFGGFLIEPTKSTSAALLNYGLLMKPFNGGFRVLYDTEFAGDHRDRETVLKEGLRLNFILRLNDAGFYNYTESFEGDISRSIFHFKNSPDRKSKLKFSLSAHDHVGDKDLHPLDYFEDTFFVKPFAVLDLQLHEGMETSYTLRFRARETYWRYILVSDYLQTLTNPAILDSDSVSSFEGPEKLPVRGKNTLAFSSKKPISFSQKGQKVFQLVDNYDAGSGRYKVVMRALPFADPSHITVIDAGGASPKSMNYSEIFIH